MTRPDATLTISCDGKLIVFVDDANSPPTKPEVVTIPLTANPSGSDDRHNKRNKTTKKTRRSSGQKKKA
jgi:hypothetical protein